MNLEGRLPFLSFSHIKYVTLEMLEPTVLVEQDF